MYWASSSALGEEEVGLVVTVSTALVAAAAVVVCYVVKEKKKEKLSCWGRIRIGVDTLELGRDWCHRHDTGGGKKRKKEKLTWLAVGVNTLGGELVIVALVIVALGGLVIVVLGEVRGLVIEALNWGSW